MYDMDAFLGTHFFIYENSCLVYYRVSVSVSSSWSRWVRRSRWKIDDEEKRGMTCAAIVKDYYTIIAKKNQPQVKLRWRQVKSHYPPRRELRSCLSSQLRSTYFPMIALQKKKACRHFYTYIYMSYLYVYMCRLSLTFLVAVRHWLFVVIHHYLSWEEFSQSFTTKIN